MPFLLPATNIRANMAELCGPGKKAAHYGPLICQTLSGLCLRKAHRQADMNRHQTLPHAPCVGAS